MEKLKDMHTHSIYSDGTDTVEEIVTKAEENDIDTIAITDHDNIEGSKIAVKYNTKNLKIYSGIELTASKSKLCRIELPPNARIHILGYNIDLDNEDLNNKLKELKENSRHNIMLYVKQLGKHPLFNVLQSRGFLEAWAVNTEINSVAWEGYSDEFVKYNAINSLYTYYTLAILDINLNYEGWGKKAATKFLEKNGFGQAADFLIQNYLDAPAYNMAYSLGSLEFNKMRDKAKATLGDTYNETDFYKIYLECGSVNFDVVNKRLDQWLEKKVKEVKESEKVEETQKAEEVKETTK